MTQLLSSTTTAVQLSVQAVLTAVLAPMMLKGMPLGHVSLRERSHSPPTTAVAAMTAAVGGCIGIGIATSLWRGHSTAHGTGCSACTSKELMTLVMANAAGCLM
jgi:hypothetical protein